MEERKVKINDEEFVITKGKGECELNVTNGKDTGKVTWHAQTLKYRGEFKGWGDQSDSLEGAVAVAAKQIIATRKGVSKEQACDEMDKYLKD